MLDDIYKLLQVSSSKNLLTIITEKRDQMGLSDFQVSQILGVNKNKYYRLIKKLEEGQTDDIDFYLVLKICQFLGISVDDMSKIYVASLSSEKIKELEMARKANYIISHFDIKGLKDASFLDTTTDFERIEQRIVSFFGLDSIFQYKTEVGAALFSRTKNTSHDKMREFWVRSASYQFEKIDNPNEYDRDSLMAIIPKIAPYTRYEEKGFHTVLQALYNVGVTVIVQSYLTKTQVRGGTFFVNGKPCIVITDYNKSYSTIWFALMHELYHVLYDLNELKALKFHLTGEAESDLFLFREDYADHFAREMLFSKEKLEFVRHIIKSPIYVSDYAEKHKIHPSIIYSFYCFDEKEKNNKDNYALYQKYFGKPDKALNVVRSNPWNKASIIEGIEKIRKNLATQSYTNG